ncbi:MAG: flagellin [Actinomycetia bacterium]|nr:flagellin [Actinomycetes bacterium]
MGLRINQNIAAMNAYRNLTVTDGQMSKSLEKLSSGFRINRAADDAAGLSISEGLRAQVGGLKVAVRNAQDGISVVQTAEGAMSEVHSILQRMRDLAVQSSNTGSQDSDARTAAQTEFDQLKTEIDRIGNTTKFGSTKLLDGSLGAVASSTGAVQTGNLNTSAVAAAHTFSVTLLDSAAVSHTVAIALADSTAYTGQAIVDAVNTAVTTAEAGWSGATTDFHAELNTGLGNTFQVALKSTASFTTSAIGAQLASTILGDAAGGAVHAPAGAGGVFQVGANNSSGGADKITVSIGDIRTAALASGVLTGVSAKIAAGTSSGIDDVDAAIKAISTARANLGAYQNRFEHTISNLSVTSENLSASESRIRDTDMAQEMVSFTRSQILTQAGTAMLAQANQAPQQVLQLLRG